MKHAVTGAPLESLPADVDWQMLLQEAHAQTVALQFFDRVSALKSQIPENIYQQSFKLARRITANNMRMEHTQRELVRVLEQELCPYVILKGEMAAYWYPVPELRCLGDVDFMVSMENTERVAERMKVLGFEHTWEPGNHHQVLEKDKTCLEMHIEVAGVPQGDAREPVRDYLASILEKRISIDRGMGVFQVPCPEHQAMVLILHMQHHVVEWGIGLRHIMDWACFMDRTAQDGFWQDSLLPLLKKIGLFHFTAVITKMASQYLGSTCPAWAEYVQPDLCEAMMEDILAGGNFGRKDKNRARAINMLPDWEKKEKKSGKVSLLYQTLRNSVLKQHPELGNKPVLRLVYMIGKTVRYAALFCVGKRPNLLKAASHADARRNVYERLRMFESEE